MTLTDRNLTANEDVYLDEEEGVENGCECNPSHIDLRVSRSNISGNSTETIWLHLVGEKDVSHHIQGPLSHHHLHFQPLNHHPTLLVFFYLRDHLLEDDIWQFGVLEEKGDAVGTLTVEPGGVKSHLVLQTCVFVDIGNILSVLCKQSLLIVDECLLLYIEAVVETLEHEIIASVL